MQTILAKNRYGQAIIGYYMSNCWNLLSIRPKQNLREIKIAILF